MDRRGRLLDDLARQLAAARTESPLRVGIDGVCGAGKTTFTRELTAELNRRGVAAIHLDSDGFHHTRAIRYRQGRDSARGYYEDAYDFQALATHVLGPLGPGGSRRYAVRVHDMATDAVIEDEFATAAPNSVVLFDCTFLQRGELRAQWDEVIFLDVDRSVSTARGIARDAEHLGGHDAAVLAYETRYMAACDIYLAEERPRERASIVIDHTDPTRPEWSQARQG